MCIECEAMWSGCSECTTNYNLATHFVGVCTACKDDFTLMTIGGVEACVADDNLIRYCDTYAIDGDYGNMDVRRALSAGEEGAPVVCSSCEGDLVE